LSISTTATSPSMFLVMNTTSTSRMIRFDDLLDLLGDLAVESVSLNPMAIVYSSGPSVIVTSCRATDCLIVRARLTSQYPVPHERSPMLDVRSQTATLARSMRPRRAVGGILQTD
jgi:hypothetical protein